MEESVVIGNDTLVSTTRASKLSGYSKDYIGQLCREDKIECRRVSGHWYVDEVGLREYQENGSDENIKKPTRERAHGMKVGNVRDDTFIYDGIEFIATARAASITGYAQDYVGQLARSGEVKARKVGRRWFVEKNSLIEHKKYNDSLLAQVQAEASGVHAKANDSSDGQENVAIHKDIQPGDVNFNVRYVAETNPSLISIQKPRSAKQKIYPPHDITSTEGIIKRKDVDIRVPASSTGMVDNRSKGAYSKPSRDAKLGTISTKTVLKSDTSRGNNKLFIILLVLILLTGTLYIYIFEVTELKLNNQGILQLKTNLNETFGELLPGNTVKYEVK